MKKKVIISACLLGEYCRYDGKTKAVDAVINKFKDCEIIPFCPEAPLFGTPRERINVVLVDNKNRIITDETNIDVTQKLKEEIASFLEKYLDADEVILKSKSPSCGLGTTPILDKDKNILEYGNGLAADMFLKQFPKSFIKDENEYI
ncbi:DUF523 domain-containing protein [Sulfurimonas lithotrophica]|uniref:DUF523 domain-containing protein n=1 Tax=Sulfurimonas lithotrophica TaxID=2590022 RepID=A0A5P8P3A6_9BACT|nr:DUF523 domain-containing protein [Sulfurimonas lithotrophica]QFR50228.1 DUF523 domain-containing protein [Sulfurimonas lithotrophica]